MFLISKCLIEFIWNGAWEYFLFIFIFFFSSEEPHIYFYSPIPIFPYQDETYALNTF